MLGHARIPRAFRWLVLPLALGLTHGAFESSADARPSKSKWSKKRKKKKKKTGGSMDDKAGRDVEEGGLAPGTRDAQASGVSITEEKREEKKPPPPPEVITLEEDEGPPEPPAPEGPPSPFPLNWLSFSVQQNLLVYPNQAGVCPAVDDNGHETLGAAGYTCVDSQGKHKNDVYAGAGNQVHAGVGLADLRFMLGYDRVLAGKLTLGARFGIAILQIPRVTGVRAPVPWHAEGKVAYYFGESPFERHGLRPYAAFAFGLAEIDGKVSVEYYKDHIGYQSGKQGTLDVWRQTGAGFLALSLGAAVPLDSLVLNGELRVQQTLGTAALAPAVALGVAYGL